MGSNMIFCYDGRTAARTTMRKNVGLYPKNKDIGIWNISVQGVIMKHILLCRLILDPSMFFLFFTF